MFGLNDYLAFKLAKAQQNELLKASGNERLAKQFFSRVLKPQRQPAAKPNRR